MRYNSERTGFVRGRSEGERNTVAGGPLLEPEQETLLATLAAAWQMRREEFRATSGYGEYTAHHAGLSKDGLPLAWPDIEALARAGFVAITAMTNGTRRFVMTAPGLAYALRAGRNEASAQRPQGAMQMMALTKADAIARLGHILGQLDNIKSGEPFSPAFQKWQNDAEVAIRHIFPNQPDRVQEFKAIHYAPQFGSMRVSSSLSRNNAPDPEALQRRIMSFAHGMETARAQLASMHDEIRDYWTDDNDAEQPAGKREQMAALGKKVFIVHGHDHGLKNTVARFLERLGLEPIILHEQPNEGRTIIEKFSDHADVSYAIALFTPDDFGGNAQTPDTRRPRARQNVVFEFGYFVGTLGRRFTCALVGKGVERPSDYDGVLYIPVDDADHWRFDLVKELRAVGFDVDANRAL